jgi:hypothetical protein
MGDTVATDYDTDMQTINQYVAAVIEAKSKISASFLRRLTTSRLSSHVRLSERRQGQHSWRDHEEPVSRRSKSLR